jgi:alpha-glucosidase (family GH31 glycosyl hydrolase)
MNKKYQLKTNPKAASRCLIEGKNYRISILTKRLIRLEYSEKGIFEDCATQKVVNRLFEVPQFQLIESSERLEIITEDLQIIYDKKSFSSNGLSIRLKKNKYSNNSIWHYGEKIENLKGTARTLDACDGKTSLEDGVLSRIGYSVIDDSNSLILGEDGWIQSPLEGHTDIYFFGYGHEYLECLKDFFHLCGNTPLLPRYALGNWWSRYYEYTQDEYIALMDRFAQEKLPFSVAVIDMDWHYVDLDEKYGSGWTGYTWNEKLFPDHKKMLDELHKRGMCVTLNVHPADGVRGHEKAYIPMAKELGVDYNNEVPISFDIANKDFLEAYFKYLHHPLEEEGVDFWWIDWQQGNSSSISGLDPLWMLNHYHYLDNRKEEKRPLIFSRYAGVGSHRYPIGFSGDSVITWKSLEFQPYFTATASNVGYGWWSHDIGGHMDGYRDDELATRWVQFGVFSPIMRLHSSNSRFTGKEPWKFGSKERKVMNRFLRLRHMLIPYLYTMNERFHSENEPLIQPMYYHYPDINEAYEVPNQYFFGSELMVNPITSKMYETIKAGSVTTWLPEGIWYDIFTGLMYHGNKMVRMYRTLESIPVLAKAGAIIPMQKLETIESRTDNPKDLEILVCVGESGEFVLYEDDGITMDFEKGLYVKTKFTLEWENTKSFIIHPVVGEESLIPALRNYQLKFYGIPEFSIDGVTVNGDNIVYKEVYDQEKNIQVIELDNMTVSDEITIRIKETASVAANTTDWRIYEVLNRAQIDYQLKDKIYTIISRTDSLDAILCDLNALEIDTKVKEIIQEILLA